jgi:hypothetical protein
MPSRKGEQSAPAESVANPQSTRFYPVRTRGKLTTLPASAARRSATA